MGGDLGGARPALAQEDGGSRVSQPALDGRQVRVAGSVGVAVWQGQAGADALLRDADAALYEAKRAGKNRVAGAPAARAAGRP
jgi:GGDEF domain-containing protein